MLYINVEKHPLRKGVYVTYGLDQTWHARRIGRNYWQAVAVTGKPSVINARTLEGIGRYLRTPPSDGYGA